MKDYSDFLSDKTHAGADHGFEPMFIPDALFDFQKHLVARAAAAAAAEAGVGILTRVDPRGPYQFAEWDALRAALDKAGEK